MLTLTVDGTQFDSTNQMLRLTSITGTATTLTTARSARRI